MRPKWKILMTSVGGAMLLGTLGAREKGCPDDMVRTSYGSCIDRFEFRRPGDVRPLLGVSAIPSRHDREAGEEWDAETLCRREGKRTCKLDEWVAACLGEHGSSYPWGEKVPNPHVVKSESFPCNAAKPWLTPDWWLISERDASEMKRLDQSEPGGGREQCTSASGAVDLVGNAEEWVRCPGKGRDGWCLMGGFWSGPRRCYDSNGTHSGRWYGYQTGLRCCLDD